MCFWTGITPDYVIDPSVLRVTVMFALKTRWSQSTVKSTITNKHCRFHFQNKGPQKLVGFRKTLWFWFKNLLSVNTDNKLWPTWPPLVMDMLVLHPHTCHPLHQQFCYRLCMRLGWCLRFTVNINITGEQWLSHTHIAHVLLWVLFTLNFWPCIYFNPKDSFTMYIFAFLPQKHVVLMLVKWFLEDYFISWKSENSLKMVFLLKCSNLTQ